MPVDNLSQLLRSNVKRLRRNMGGLVWTSANDGRQLLLKITLLRLSIFFASLFSVIIIAGDGPYTQDGLIDGSANVKGQNLA